MLTIYMPTSPRERSLTLLRQRLPPEVLIHTGEALPDPPDYQILVTGRPTREQLIASPRLHALLVPWAGLPRETQLLMREFPQIAVHNLHYNAQPVAELAAALLLAAAKYLVPLDRSMRANDWTPRYQQVPALLLYGKKALILGYGAIGRQLAPICRGLGMEVFATRRSLAEPHDEDGVQIYPAAALPNLLPQVHALLVCLPHTDETDGLIGAGELALLPRQAVVVNVGRGPIIDQAALYKALHSGTIHAAGLDVWYNYPRDEPERKATPPADWPFHELDNLVMSPHRGGALFDEENEALRAEHLAHTLAAALRGEPLPHRVDIERGY